MNRKALVAVGTFSLVALVASAGVMLAPKHAGANDEKIKAPAAKADAKAGKTYAVDPVHASVVFKIKHLNASNFYGTLNDISGSFTTGATFSADVKVKADSVDSRNDKRDQHIKSPDFFSAKEFPEMSFTAKDLAASGNDGWKGTGQLTFRGVTKPVEVEIKKTGSGPGMQGGEVAGIETSFTFKRSDFGSTKLIGPLSDEVTIIVALEGSSK
jgi:polyisoprenoid-binding protein YceI